MTGRALLRVIIADDHPLYRAGVEASLAREPDIEVIGQASDGHEAIRIALDRPADVVLLDLSMPAGGGMVCIEQLTATPHPTRVLVVTASDDATDVASSFRAGASGYVLKGTSGRELAGAVRAVAAGHAFLSPALGAALMTPQIAAADAFTSREVDVIELLATGMTNREIGERLYLAEKTVKHHVTHIFQKLGARNRLEAVLLAQRAGLLAARTNR